MGKKFKAAIVGATGYTGQELVRLLVSHPDVEICALTSRQNKGVKYSDIYPQFLGYGLPKLSVYSPKTLKNKADIVFFCLPHAKSQEVVGQAVDMGIKAIDLSADFRLDKVSDYKRYYGPHKRTDLFKKAAYGIPEIYRDKIKKADLTATPGCYPTGVIIGVAPFMREGVADPSHVIADMKSGTSGAGRKASIPLNFSEVNEGLRAYNLYGHRHTSEMEQELSKANGKKVRVTFTPHLVPMNRGILGTIYINLIKKCTASSLQSILEWAYCDEQFVRVLPKGTLPCVSNVRGTNFVDIAVTISPTGKDAIITTAIDNLVKGASGAAVQNMNVMLGIPEETGLLAAAIRP